MPETQLYSFLMRPVSSTATVCPRYKPTEVVISLVSYPVVSFCVQLVSIVFASRLRDQDKLRSSGSGWINFLITVRENG